MSGDRVLTALRTSVAGLTEPDACGRLARDGPNELPMPKRAGIFRVMLRQLRSPLALVLVVALALALLTGAGTDAAFIAAVIAVNAAIGGAQEWRAERRAASLQGLLRMRATVLRAGAVREIDAREVVVGDILLVETGSRVAADARLIAESGLEVDESLLTGESVQVAKDFGWVGDDAAVPLADRLNMIHAGTSVVRGRGRAVVVATGGRSSIGRLAGAVDSADAGATPLVIRLRRFSRTLGLLSLSAAALVVAIGWLLRGFGLGEMAVFGVALAVSVIPEGLPVAITIALSVATVRMAGRGVVVRRLDAVEGLGSCTIIASDKTGTLTCNEVTVREVRLAGGRVLRISGQGFVPEGGVDPARDTLDPAARQQLDRIAVAAALCNEASLGRADDRWTWRGDPTEVALLCFSAKLGASRQELLSRFPEVGRVAFEPERRYAMALHEVEGTTRMMAIGAPEQIATMCREGGAPDLETARAMAASGLRVLAVATADGPPGDRFRPPPAEGACDPLRALAAGDDALGDPEASGLARSHEASGLVGTLEASGLGGTLEATGLIGMLDPLRPGAAQAVGRCRDLGIRVLMVTGDHPATALAIARELGLAQRADQVLTGAQFDQLGAEERGQLLGDDRNLVFARFDPSQKLGLVEAAMRSGQLVAVTGDGANDAPALQVANIGIAMGRSGTDAARDAADLVIVDDNFATIVAGVEEGRIAFANIRKVVYLLLSTNGAEAVMVIGALLTGLPLPLLPTQLLWLNLATEGLQDVGLAFEPAEERVARRPPAGDSIFDRWMIERLLVGSITMGAISLATYAIMIAKAVPTDEARNTLLLLMVMLENVQVGCSRSEHRLLVTMKPWGNPLLLGAVLGSFALQLTAMHWSPLASVLQSGPIPMRGWLGCAALATLLLLVLELHKWTRSPMRRSPAGSAGISADR